MSQEPGGSPLTRKYGGIPGYVWLIGAGVLAYFLFFKGSSSPSGTSSNPSGTSDNSSTDLSGSTINPPSNPVTVNLTNGTPNPQPKPKPPPKKKVVQKKKPVKAKPKPPVKTPGEPED